MYLKSLTLKGFKSFADRAHLAFESGLTVIVGPNGSGKSNVSDAILWVLGEQSAKQLRGQAMEDVVFAGSSARKPVAVAEVDLALDNSDHVLPVDFDEVVITRRMYRSGESEYLVNGSPARLLDITDILHDSGLGKDTHSIISQGKLDAILTSRPEERRALIEEAAGISKHKRRRERAERKMASMDAHVRRALDVQKEIMRQLRPLERQVAKARRHREVASRAAELRTLLAVDDLRRLKERWAQLEATARAAEAELATAQAHLGRSQAFLDDLQARSDEHTDAVEGAMRQRGRCQRVCDRLGAGVRLLEEKRRSLTEKLDDAAAALQKAQARSHEVRGELADAVAARDGGRLLLADLRERDNAARARVRDARAARRVAEDRLTHASAALRGAQHDRDTASVALARARDAVEAAHVQNELLAARVSQLEEEAGAARRDAEAVGGRLARVRDELACARDAERTGRERVSSARAGLCDARAAEDAAQRALAATDAQATALERAARAGENAAPLVGKLALDASAAVRVNEILEVPSELSQLVEVLLADGLAGFVADDDTGVACLALKAQRLAASAAGRVHIVNRSRSGRTYAGDESLPGYALLERISVREGYEGVARALLGDVRVVEGVEEALAASAADPQGVYTTPQGCHAYAGGCVSVGCAGGAASGLLEIRRRQRELKARLPELAEALDVAERRAAQAEEELSRLRDDLEGQAQIVARLTGEESSLASQAKRLAQVDAASSKELDRIRAQRDAASDRTAKAADEAERASRSLESAQEKIGELDREVRIAQEAFDAARREDRAAHDEANACQLELARMQERDAALEDRCVRLEREQGELAGSLDERRTRAAELGVMAARIQAPLARLAALEAEARVYAEVAAMRAGEADARTCAFKRELEDARVAVADAVLGEKRAAAAANDVKVEQGRLDVQVQTAVKAICDQNDVVLEEVLGLPAPVDRGADERELRRLEAELAQIGPVNQVAFEEYDNLKRRADYIAEQVDDLQRARADLHKILAAIDRKMRASFVETFERVNDNFIEMFAMLFPGGSGRLEMTDPDDVAATGIEVVAQPHGKRVTKMSLLSGGERSLTALGLLFAVYRTRTVPFYVLDEVEAALDDSNLDRLLAALDVLRTSTQLIVISHQRRTMESADVLYGVSMQADGVSRVVSQKLDRAVPARRA